MNRLAVSVGVVVVALSAVAIGRLAAQHAAEPAPAAITIDYPAQDSIFPPDMVAPTFLWRDPAKTAAVWRIDIEFADASPAIHLKVPGERMQVGEIDPRAVSSTNEAPKLTPQQAEARTWKPDAETWAQIKRRSLAGKAIVTIAGVTDRNADRALSRGQVTIQTSQRSGRCADLLSRCPAHARGGGKRRHQAPGCKGRAADRLAAAQHLRTAQPRLMTGFTPAPIATRSRATARRWVSIWTARRTTRACMPSFRSGSR